MEKITFLITFITWQNFCIPKWDQREASQAPGVPRKGMILEEGWGLMEGFTQRQSGRSKGEMGMPLAQRSPRAGDGERRGAFWPGFPARTWTGSGNAVMFAEASRSPVWEAGRILCHLLSGLRTNCQPCLQIQFSW